MKRFLQSFSVPIWASWLIANILGWGFAFGVLGGAVGSASYLSFLLPKNISEAIPSLLFFGIVGMVSSLMGLGPGIAQAFTLRSKALSPKPWVLAYVLGFMIGGMGTWFFYYIAGDVLNNHIGLDWLFTGLLMGGCLMLLSQWLLLKESGYPSFFSLTVNSINISVTCFFAAIFVLPHLILASWNLGEYWDIYWGKEAWDFVYYSFGFMFFWALWGSLSGFLGGVASGFLILVCFRKKYERLTYT